MAAHAPTNAGRESGRLPEPAAGGRKLPYEKPHLHTIELAAEEVLAVGCKLSGGPGGPIGANCTASACFSAGS